jgi:hypothetical protein
MPKTIIDERGVVIVPGTGVEINLPVSFSNTASFDSTVEETGDATYDGDYVFSGTAEFAGEATFANTSSFAGEAEFTGSVVFSGSADFAAEATFANTSSFVGPTGFTGSVSYQQGPTIQANLVTVDFTVMNPGGFLLDALSVLTGTLPDPNTFPFGDFGFVSLQDQEHVLTCSAVPYNAFVASDGVMSGTKLVMGADSLDSVILKSDGIRYFVIASSGSTSYANSL